MPSGLKRPEGLSGAAFAKHVLQQVMAPSDRPQREHARDRDAYFDMMTAQERDHLRAMAESELQRLGGPAATTGVGARRAAP